MTRKKTVKNQTSNDNTTTLRLSKSNYEKLKNAALKLGMPSVEEYLSYLGNKETKLVAHPAVKEQQSIYDILKPTEYLKTDYGQIFCGDSIGLLHKILKPGSVDLIVTSPPFGLVRKKAYGNEDADQYVEWFKPFAEGMSRVLKNQGSLVIDIGSAWKSGTPTKSLYHFELLITLCRDFGFHLCQEHYWWNPSRLPTPAEWVNIRRIRVKDAVNCIWWLSKTPWPKASNKRVLAPYSESMKTLLKDGYTPKLRPSGHDISTKFNRDNKGSVPPNLIALANTESNSFYQEYCKTNGLPIHPARFPAGIPEYFIRMLTDKGDFIVDPFAGSCVTGEVAEALKRKWICCDLIEDYLKGAKARFIDKRPTNRSTSCKPYQIYPPCSLGHELISFPLPADGGFQRP